MINMISKIISSIIELENNSSPRIELDTIINEVLNIVKWEIKKFIVGFDIISYYDGDYQTIEIISKDLTRKDIYVKIIIDSEKKGYNICLSHDWLKFKDTTKL